MHCFISVFYLLKSYRNIVSNSSEVFLNFTRSHNFVEFFSNFFELFDTFCFKFTKNFCWSLQKCFQFFWTLLQILQNFSYLHQPTYWFPILGFRNNAIRKRKPIASVLSKMKNESTRASVTGGWRSFPFVDIEYFIYFSLKLNIVDCRMAQKRCRMKKKRWIMQLKSETECVLSKNQKLQTEICSLRAEIAHLKTLLLAHRNCSVTRAMYKGKAFVVGRDIRSVGLLNKFLAILREAVRLAKNFLASYSKVIFIRLTQFEGEIRA